MTSELPRDRSAKQGDSSERSILGHDGDRRLAHSRIDSLYQPAECLTLRDSQISDKLIQGGKRRVVCHGPGYCGADGLYGGRGSSACDTGERCRTSAAAVGDRGGARGGLAGRRGGDRWDGSPDVAGLGDPINERGPDGLINIPSPGVPPKLDATHKAFLARIVEEGPIPAVHGVVRWRACDLIMRLHEEFGFSVSDDTIYRALKDLGFSHVSARPKAYKQDAEAMDAFKKTSPSAWRTSARNSRRAHR